MLGDPPRFDVCGSETARPFNVKKTRNMTVHLPVAGVGVMQIQKATHGHGAHGVNRLVTRSND
jgi:hypothetical protein